jgi:hypothetical protein
LLLLLLLRAVRVESRAFHECGGHLVEVHIWREVDAALDLLSQTLEVGDGCSGRGELLLHRAHLL